MNNTTKKPRLTREQRLSQISQILDDAGNATAYQLADIAGISASYVSRLLKQLEKENEVVRVPRDLIRFGKQTYTWELR